VSKDSDQGEASPKKFKLGHLASLNQVTTGSAQSRRARLHLGLRRALLRTLRHAHLDRGVLDLCRGAQ